MSTGEPDLPSDTAATAWAKDGHLPTERFSDRARDYTVSRPSYPPEIFRDLVAGLKPAPPHSHLRAVDVGAGTGISARLLADQGVVVTAAEPNAAMRLEAAPHPMVTMTADRAESLSLPDRACDIWLAAQAYHWFDGATALAEAGRVVRPGGRIAVLWNVRDDSDSFTAAYSSVIISHVGVDPSLTRLGTISREFVEAGLGSLRMARARHHARHDLSGLLTRIRSASYIPREGPQHDQIIADLTALYHRHADAGGHVSLAYEARLFFAERP